MQLRYIREHRYDEQWKFCFVRNPYDWFVSMYDFCLHWKQGHRLLSSAKKLGFQRFCYHIMENENWNQDLFIETCDFVGKYENIVQDWKVVEEKVGQEMPLMTLNKYGSSERNYKDYYVDADELINDIKEYNKNVIERFNYLF